MHICSTDSVYIIYTIRNNKDEIDCKTHTGVYFNICKLVLLN